MAAASESSLSIYLRANANLSSYVISGSGALRRSGLTDAACEQHTVHPILQQQKLQQPSTISLVHVVLILNTAAAAAVAEFLQ